MQAVQEAVQARENPSPPEEVRGLDERLTAVSELMDERLTVAALAVAVNTALRLPDVAPVDLADVIRTPAAVPAGRPPVDLYPTPVAALMQRARARLEADGWCQGATVDEDGARCLYGALRAEASGEGELHNALSVLLEAIRRDFPDAESVPDFNDRHGPRVVFRSLERAADLAHARNL